MEMPTICFDCDGSFELNDLMWCRVCRDQKLRCDNCDDRHEYECHTREESEEDERENQRDHERAHSASRLG